MSVNFKRLQLARGLRFAEVRKHTMTRSAAFQRLARTIHIARFCDRHCLSTSEGLDQAAVLEAAGERGVSRREFLTGAAKLAALGAIGAVASPFGRALATPRPPLTKGSDTCKQPGYFTTIADNEQKPVGNLFFAGEHTSSFYEWQGFMEGGALSGLRAAAEVLQVL